MRDLTAVTHELLLKDYESILSALAIASEGASDEQRAIHNDVTDKIVLYLESIDNFVGSQSKINN